MADEINKTNGQMSEEDMRADLEGDFTELERKNNELINNGEVNAKKIKEKKIN